MVETELTSLILVQEEKLERLRKTFTNYKKTPKERLTQSYIEIKSENLEKLWKDFNDMHTKILLKIKRESLQSITYFSDDIYSKCENIFEEYMTKLKEDLRKYTTTRQDHVCDAVTNPIIQDVKLPRIQLPKFSGSYSEWQTFYDMFISLIHNNTALSSVQKLHYLKNNLSGEPEALLQNLSTIETNYEEAWARLTRRYNNKRYNANEILKRLFSQRSIMGESSSAVKQLLDTTVTCLNSLNTLGIETSSWDTIMIYITTSKLDPESRKQWETQVCNMKANSLPEWEQLVKFLETRFRTLEMIETTKPRCTYSTNSVKQMSKSKSFHSTIREETKKKGISCVMCSEAHMLYQCKQFSKQSPEERSSYVQSKRLCFNCLAPTHNVKSCHQSTCCRLCGRRHHTLLHKERGNRESQQTLNEGTTKPENSESYLSNEDTENKIQSHFTSKKSNYDQVLLATASVLVQSKTGQMHTFRALLDQGSQASFVTESTVQFLGIKRTPVTGIVSGVGNAQTKIKYMATFNIQSHHDSEFSIEVNAFILGSLTYCLPAHQVPASEWLDTEMLQLADPNYSSPGRIHILLGAEVYSEILLHGIKRKPNGGLVAQNTRLGWILSGKIVGDAPSLRNIVNFHLRVQDNELLRKFWEIEREPETIEKKLTNEEKQCEHYYETTTTRDQEGRYTVRLPFKDCNPKDLLGEMRKIAQHRFNLLERRLLKDPCLYKEYKDVLQEYLDLNHMALITERNEIDNPNGVYLPHHAIIRKDKKTTKVRIVFDASAKGVNKCSLNECFLIGPKLQQDLRHILMRWRNHPVCLVADIVKMYRQICVHSEHTDYQRLLWRNHPENSMKHYKLLRLTFGTACAPYLAVKTLQTLARDEELKYPRASKITLTDFYMDDLMTGCQTEEEAIELYEEINKLMKAGGFELQKWGTNSQRLKDHLMEESKGLENQRPIRECDTMKVLGINWNKNSDSFEYTIQLSDISYPITKRKVLSDIARLYDPMGWIAPIIITAKIYIQKLWVSGLDWDDELTMNLLKEWVNYRESLRNVKNIIIPRWVRVRSTCKVELHAFSDASADAYAAAVYIRVINPLGKIFVHLVTAKTKVAPIDKPISIPRLELCGALLAARLLHEVALVMKISKENLFAWTDSTIVLAWLRGLPNRWTIFVTNRVSEILNILDFDQWSHISTSENPADAASRGLPVQSLTNNILWWTGPQWLQEPVIPKGIPNFATNEEERSVRTVSASVVLQKENFLWVRFSTLFKMQRVMSYCKRVFKSNKPESLIITPTEANETLELCIRQCQQFHFGEEIKQLKLHKNLLNKNPLHTLNLYLDGKGILRVGGRIDHAQCGYETKHPIILPSKSHLTNLLITDAHMKTLHGGPQLMLNYLRSKFWILKAREEVKKCYRKCVPCVRYSKIKNNQLMGQLPEVRVRPTRPFKSSGVDFTGFIKIRFSPGRGSKCYKGYICLFVCMATRAIHLEAVSDLSAQGFINAFRRFVSRRGHCADIFSDNGTNFIGACKILQDMHNQAKSGLPSELQNLLAREGTTWHFIPPHAPNFGGLWEAGVRSVKSHLKRVIGESTLTFEELSTVLSEIEACLNSRPLSQLSNDKDDLLPLTPGHFLVGEPLVTIPNEDHTKTHISGLKRWILTQKMVNDFWKRWADEYLVTLNQRYKWSVKISEPELEDIVLIKEDNLPPARWLLGRVVQKHPGKDNITRVVTLKTKTGLLKRPCNKLCILPKDTSHV